MDEGNWASDPMSGYSLGNIVSGVPDVVTHVELSQARPNPFNPTTEIGYALPVPGHVRLRIFDVSGRMVGTLVDREKPAGRHCASWSGRDDGGRAVASGVYFYQLDAGGKTFRKSMTLLK